MLKKVEILPIFFPLLIASFAAAGLAVDGLDVLSGFLRIQLQPARLINDFIMTEGLGAALLNSAAVGFVGYLLIRLTRTTLSGPTFAAVLTMMGFGLFGKTPVNIIPIIAGVYMSARFARKSFKEYIIIALFGTALGPLVSTLAAELGLPAAGSLIAGAAGGLTAGFFLPAVAVAMLHMHQGYNLYNMGLTCGFLSIFAASVIKAGGQPLSGYGNWHTGNPLITVLMIPVISIVMLLLGILSGAGRSFSGFLKIQRQPGRLPSDFIDLTSAGAALVNSAAIGLIGSAYILLIGGDFNGATIGGLLTIMGFGAFGTHLKNSWPVITGVILAALLFGMPLTSPGVLLAAIFCTTLAPVAGQFGIIPGLVAGFLHLLLVSQTGSWQGGINLYNNGFAGGLTATLIIAVVQWYRNNKNGNS
jgi:hypothetical protein